MVLPSESAPPGTTLSAPEPPMLPAFQVSEPLRLMLPAPLIAPPPPPLGNARYMFEPAKVVVPLMTCCAPLAIRSMVADPPIYEPAECVKVPEAKTTVPELARIVPELTY